jgi:hypothetical protein
MAIKGAIRIDVEHDTVFPSGALFLSVDRQIDFERRGKGDDQARDKESGERVWVVKVMDQDPEARQSEVRVKVTAPHMPVPPAPQGGGVPAPGRVRGPDPHALSGLVPAVFGRAMRVPAGLQPAGHRDP